MTRPFLSSLPPQLRDWKGPGKIVHVAAKTLHEVYKSIFTIAETTNSLKKAKVIVKRMKQEFAQIKKPAKPSREFTLLAMPSSTAQDLDLQKEQEGFRRY